MEWKKKIFKGLLAFTACVFIYSCASTGGGFSGTNTGNPMSASKTSSSAQPFKINQKKYLNNNEKRKSVWTKISLIHGSDCPTFKNYKSTADKKREKLMRKAEKRAQGNLKK